MNFKIAFLLRISFLIILFIFSLKSYSISNSQCFVLFSRNVNILENLSIHRLISNMESRYARQEFNNEVSGQKTQYVCTLSEGKVSITTRVQEGDSLPWAKTGSGVEAANHIKNEQTVHFNEPKASVVSPVPFLEGGFIIGRVDGSMAIYTRKGKYLEFNLNYYEIKTKDIFDWEIGAEKIVESDAPRGVELEIFNNGFYARDKTTNKYYRVNNLNWRNVADYMFIKRTSPEAIVSIYLDNKSGEIHFLTASGERKVIRYLQ